MNDSINILDIRIGSLETTYFAQPKSTELLNTKWDQTLDRITKKIDDIDREMPIFKDCFKSVQSLQALITEKKMDSQKLSIRLNTLSNGRNELLQSIDALNDVKDLSYLLGAEIFGNLGKITYFLNPTF